MKKYIQPTTQVMAVVYGTSLMISLGGGDDPAHADAPVQKFHGDKLPVKVVYI